MAFISPLGLATVLLGREPEPEVEAELAFMNLVSIFESHPLTHLVFEEPELGKLGVDKLDSGCNYFLGFDCNGFDCFDCFEREENWEVEFDLQPSEDGNWYFLGCS
ncbi:hypothetical protein Tco_0960043 [Tanacetum coccineum]